MNPPSILGRLVADLYTSDAGPAATQLLAEPPRLAPAAPPAARRRKLWELEEKHHCPVIGTCIPLDELVRLARRFRFEASLKDEFALHAEAVQRSMVRNDVAEALHKHLERKYAVAIGRFDSAGTDDEVHALWKARLAQSL
jgi:hypothetical protein